MIIGQKYVDKKEVLNKLITRIEEGISCIEKKPTIGGVCFLGLLEDLIRAKIDILKKLLDSPLAEEFNPDVYTEDANACQLVYGDIEVEYHLRLGLIIGDEVRVTDFLLFEDVLNPEEEERFEEEIELLAENIAKECGDVYNFEKAELSYIKLTHIK